ncbi:hypothetical protein [Thiorhodovibrio frisius]|uniref:Uncharacterized protein n=1 Tax=Thiorhodovibrio frisius TaxID=631362 RepID=H8YVZ2_9GAMM|nr:hypothetical protein [Thiorhodovibrio frisius]EIC23783.1 hypothetical protein Thi970DRAFT_00294 [Thiorhodovibrio frisius]WPL23208.1 hypothetical protein Thiofri_03391 [Thiorhodovibrio frisius]
MTPAFLWHRACSILKLGQSKRGGGWPDALNIEHIATLHYYRDGDMAEALRSLLAAAIASGSLEPAGCDRIEGDEDYRLLARRMGLESRAPATRTRDIPMVSRGAYRDWPDRPDIPGDSPLHGWIDAPERPEESGDDWRRDPGIDPSEKQERAILETLKALGYDPLAVPNGGKAKARELCGIEYPELFSPTSFGTAWNRLKDAQKVRMKNHSRYSHRGAD